MTHGIVVNPEVGQTYRVKHSRKGIFEMRVTGVDKDWAHGVITDGFAGAILPYNEREVGEDITVRRSFCVFSAAPTPTED